MVHFHYITTLFLCILLSKGLTLLTILNDNDGFDDGHWFPSLGVIPVKPPPPDVSVFLSSGQAFLLLTQQQFPSLKRAELLPCPSGWVPEMFLVMYFCALYN